MDDSQKKHAIARIRNVMKKADEKIIKLNREKRMKECIKQEKLAKDREEEKVISKRYRSKVYNRKKSERLEVLSAFTEEKQMRESENYKVYTDSGMSASPVEGDAAVDTNTSIDMII
jgi:transcriptional regulator with PAS, ATPase and Fis domain